MVQLINTVTVGYDRYSNFELNAIKYTIFDNCAQSSIYRVTITLSNTIPFLEPINCCRILFE